MRVRRQGHELRAVLRSRSRQEPEPIFFWSEPGAGAAFFKVIPAPAASFRQAKEKSLVLVSNMTLKGQ